MRNNSWKRVLSAFVTGVMAAQVLSPVVAYADDTSSETVVASSDSTVSTGDAVIVSESTNSSDASSDSTSSESSESKENVSSEATEGTSDSTDSSANSTESTTDSSAPASSSSDAEETPAPESEAASSSEETDKNSSESVVSKIISLVTGSSESSSESSSEETSDSETTSENVHTVVINKNGCNYQGQWIAEANKPKSAIESMHQETAETAQSDNCYVYDDGSKISWVDADDCITYTVEGLDSIQISSPGAPTEDETFAGWTVSPDGSFDSDTHTLTFTSDQTYTLSANFKSLNTDENSLIENGQLVSNYIEENGVADIDEDTVLGGSSSGTSAFALKPTSDPWNTASMFDLMIEGVEYTYDDGGKIQTFTAPYEGDYTVEAYGANGGTGYGLADGKYPKTRSIAFATDCIGRGGSTKATVHLKKGQTIYMYMGEAGGEITDSNLSTASQRTFGGGGGQGLDWSKMYWAEIEAKIAGVEVGSNITRHLYGRGGGATYVCIDNWQMDQSNPAQHDYYSSSYPDTTGKYGNEQAQNNAAAETAKKHVILLAGGGGGGGETVASNDGGGLEAETVDGGKYYSWYDTAECNWSIPMVWGRKLTYSEYAYAKVFPATQTRAGYGLHTAINVDGKDGLYEDKEARAFGSFFWGANGFSCSGAGGGGWFGGGADWAFGGGGGSSFINTSLTLSDGTVMEVTDGSTVTGGNHKYDDTKTWPCDINGRVIIRLAGSDPEIKTIMQKAADEDVSKNNIDTNDEYGQFVMLDIGTDVASKTVKYTAITYYNYGDQMTVTPVWQYKTYLNPNYNEWTESVAKSIDSRQSVSITHTNLGKLKSGDKYYNAAYDGYWAIKSEMTITNPVYAMYDTSAMTFYNFRVKATGTYTTASGTTTISSAGDCGGLRMDYENALHHQGIHVYENTNNINDTIVTTVQQSVDATTNHDYSVWQYPYIEIISSKTVNTVLVQFSSQGFNTSDKITYDTSMASNLGLSVTGNGYYYIFKSGTLNSVSLDQWNTFLRTVQFTTYDVAQFTADDVIGGVDITWIADEAQWSGDQFYNSSTGSFYQVINNGSSITWDEARTKAKSMYNAALNTYGYLVHIASAEEQAFLNTMFPSNTQGWIGAARKIDPNNVWDWYWVDGPESEQTKPFFRQTTNGEYGTLLWGYENWHYDTVEKCQEPDNDDNGNNPEGVVGEETAVHWVAGGNGTWNDYNPRNLAVEYYCVEWSGSLNKTCSDTDTIGTQVSAETQDKDVTPAVISGTVWAENDNDGQYDMTSEATVQDVTVYLLDASGNTVSQTTTNKYGSYAFSNVANGTYSLKFVSDSYTNYAAVPSGETKTSSHATNKSGNTATTAQFTAKENDVITKNFGFYVPSSISGTAWNDKDNDGLKDSGETPVAGIYVSLIYDDGTGMPAKDTSGNYIVSCKTDANGNYTFNNVIPGKTYKVEFSSSETVSLINAKVTTIPSPTNDESITNKAVGNYNGSITSISAPNVDLGITTAEISGIYVKTMASDDTSKRGTFTPVNVLYKNAGFSVDRSISGYVWAESDYNGQNDNLYDTDVTSNHEPMVGGVTVSLIDNVTGKVVNQIQSEDNGYYEFRGVDQGSYHVEFKMSKDKMDVDTYAGLQDAKVSKQASSSNTDVEEPLLNNALGQGTTATTVKSNTIQFDYVEVKDLSDAMNAYRRWANCAYFLDAEINGVAWIDANGNGKRDDNEALLTGATVTLVDEKGNAVKDVFGNVVASTKTDSKGYYEFKNVIPDIFYQVLVGNTSAQINLANSAVTKYRASGVNEDYNNDAYDYDLGTDYSAVIKQINVPNLTNVRETTDTSKIGYTGKVVRSQSIVDHMDIGMQRIQTVKGTAWIETNSNWLRDDSEKVIKGLKVCLVDYTTGKEAVSNSNKKLQAVTDDSGNYTITGIPSGKYRVIVYGYPDSDTAKMSLVPKWVGKSTQSASTANKDSDFETAGATYSNVGDYMSTVLDFTVNADSAGNTELTYSNIDIGLQQTRSLSGKVWLDENGDGIIDSGEKTIPNVKVTITDKNGNPVKDFNGNPIEATTTDENGEYKFDNLPSGDYIIHITDGNTVIDDMKVSPKQNDNDATGTTKDHTLTEATIDLTLTETDKDIEKNAGLTVNRMIFGLVFVDANGNGRRDADEEILTDIKVSIKTDTLIPLSIKDVYGNTVEDQTTGEITLQDYDYTFTGYVFEHLKAGNYKVEFDGTDNPDIAWEELSSTTLHAYYPNLDSDTTDEKTLIGNKLDKTTFSITLPKLETKDNGNEYFLNPYMDSGLASETTTITKTSNYANGTVFHEGDSITYTITVTSPVDRNDLMVEDTLPEGLTLTNIQGYNISDVFNETSRKLQFKGIKSRTTTYVYTVTVDSLDGTGFVVFQNQASLKTYDPEHSLEITKSADKTEAKVGDTITYTLHVKNTGTETLPYVYVYEYASDFTGSSYYDGIPRAEPALDGYDIDEAIWEQSQTIADWYLEDLTAGETRDLTYTYTVTEDDDNSTLSNVARAYAPNPDDRSTPFADEEISNRVDVKVGDNYKSIIIEKSANRKNAAVGDVITYTLKVTNNGTIDLTNVMVADTNSGFGDITCIPGNGYEINDDKTWTIPDLIVGQSVYITYTYTVQKNDHRVLQEMALLSIERYYSNASYIYNVAEAYSQGTNPEDPSNPGHGINPDKPIDEDYNTTSNVVQVAIVDEEEVDPVPSNPKSDIVTHYAIAREIGNFDKSVSLVNAMGTVGNAQYGTEADPIPVNRGQTVEYTITIKNSSENLPESLKRNEVALSGDIIVTDKLNPETELVAKSNKVQIQKGSSAKLKSFVNDNGTLTWTLNSLSENEVITIKFRVIAPLTSDDTSTTDVYETSKLFTNTAHLVDVDKQNTVYQNDVYETDENGNKTLIHKAGEHVYPDDVVNMDTPTTYCVVKEPLLSGTKSQTTGGGDTTVDPNEEVVYTLTVTNSGELAADDVIFMDPLPAGIKFVDCSDDGEYDADLHKVIWNLGELDIGETKTVTVTCAASYRRHEDQTFSNYGEFSYIPKDVTSEGKPIAKSTRSAGITNTVVLTMAGDPTVPATPTAGGGSSGTRKAYQYIKAKLAAAIAAASAKTKDKVSATGIEVPVIAIGFVVAAAAVGGGIFALTRKKKKEQSQEDE